MITTNEQIKQGRENVFRKLTDLNASDKDRLNILVFVDNLIALVEQQKKTIDYTLQQKEASVKRVIESYHEQGHPDLRKERMGLVKTVLSALIGGGGVWDNVAGHAVEVADAVLAKMSEKVAPARVYLDFLDKSDNVLFMFASKAGNEPSILDLKALPSDVVKAQLRIEP